ncbi:MAG TPA: 50S ribosomal protein L3 N(5)-glutamine methyltransferase [Burkholderiales bacterium]|nr:50S ribosomal protein L3 N(5)-glutamine methyltransferase [Burkholderiales bacterium]
MTPREIERRLSRAKLGYGHGTWNAREEAAWLRSRVKDPKRLEALLDRRIRERIPLAYLLNEAWLGERAFYVDERAIVPRSFIAELLRERLRPWLARAPRRALDLCTGSGCLAVLLALTFPGVRVDASDVSGDALQVARRNVENYRLKKRIRLLRSNLFKSLRRRKYDLIVCNPPYVTARSMRRLPKEYRHEPALALAAGKDGLDFVRRLIGSARAHLRPGGMLVCEIGGNRRALERAYPKLEFAWPATSDPGTVFILPRERLPARARREGSRRSGATRGAGSRAGGARGARARARPR